MKLALPIGKSVYRLFSARTEWNNARWNDPTRGVARQIDIALTDSTQALFDFHVSAVLWNRLQQDL